MWSTGITGYQYRLPLVEMYQFITNWVGGQFQDNDGPIFTVVYLFIILQRIG